MIWLRLENLALHITNVILLFLLQRRLFGVVLPNGAPDATAPSIGALSPSWLACAGALLFALHPAAVYGVAYLVQRTILMATTFALATWLLFLEGIVRGQRRWLLVSVVTYLLAVLSKEHAIMVPAVAGAMLLLVHKPDRRLFSRMWPIFFLYAVVGLFIIFQTRNRAILGTTYEPESAGMLQELGITPQWAYPLSVLSQSYLYFKYLGLWLLPNPAWMSIDMLEHFATKLWSWPEILGGAGFAGYGGIAIFLLFKRREKGLLGFAMLGPWLLFATELASVRVREIFVLYRSYLWMPCIFAAMPFLFQRLPARVTSGILAAAALAIAFASWSQLNVFADPVSLWDDALQLAREKKEVSHIGIGGLYCGRGEAYVARRLYPQAIRDLEEAVKQLPQYSRLYNELAFSYQNTGNYSLALANYSRAIQLDPSYYNPYLGRAQILEAQGNPLAAQRDYEQCCRMGITEVCNYTIVRSPAH